MMRRVPPALPTCLPAWAILATIAACGAAHTQVAGVPAPAGRPDRLSGPEQDTTGGALVPPGYGSLRQDDIAMRLTLRGAIQVRVLPLDETVTRLLSPDSYRAMHDLQEGTRARVAAIARRYNLHRPTLFYVSFYGLQPDARFSPMELVITSSGRDFRPVDVIPLTAGFGEQRIGQRETQSAVYVYEDGIDVLQPMTLTLEGTQDESWEATLPTIERERSLVRSRARQAGRP